MLLALFNKIKHENKVQAGRDEAARAIKMAEMEAARLQNKKSKRLDKAE